jgi:signal transduction histidine kinase
MGERRTSIARIRGSRTLSLCAWLILAAVGASPAICATNSLEINSVTVNGNPAALRSDGSVSLGSFPENIIFGFQPAANSRPPIRLRYRLKGFDNEWHEGGGEMALNIRFYNEAGDQISQKIFNVRGDSPGWTGSLENSQLSHRRETLVVPPDASRVWVVISSAGPPSSVGIYVVANLVVSKPSSNQPPTILIQSPFDLPSNRDDTNAVPTGWTKDGIRPSMAKIVRFGQEPPLKAFAILDDDPISHAEWRTVKEYAPAVTPGDHLLAEWNEMFSIGVGDFRSITYQRLPYGTFEFQLMEVDPFGGSTGLQNSLTVIVPPPVWRRSWFWSVVLIAVTAAIAGGMRYLGWKKMQREMLRLKAQRTLERERLRIAHDIHDDLGARVTQISLVSAVSQKDTAFPEKARAEFDRISRMSRELVSALYETVWAVNPENDNLDALGNYVCQMVNQLCEPSGFRCRFDMVDLPREIQVSSHIRHNIIMAVKEAVHNVIKHAKASEVTIRMTFNGRQITVVVQDNGRGFNPETSQAGHGLANMRKRLENIGGNCSIESKPGHGSTVCLRLVLPSEKNARNN